MLDLPAIIGHRGAAAEAPENTLASIRQAHVSGARMVEFDVKLTRDGEPVLMHDERLERTTDGEGRVRDTDLAEIRRLDAGSWFDPGFNGEPVPTLGEAARLCLELGLGMNVEIKPCPGLAAETTLAAVHELRRAWSPSAMDPLLSSFDEAALEAARDAAPMWPRGYLATRLTSDWRARFERLACTTVHLGVRRLTRAAAAAVVEMQIPLLVYTVNDVDQARRIFAQGARSIITDRVRSMADVSSAA